MKKHKCEECLRCVSVPNNGREYDGYCLEMEMVVDVRSEACLLAAIETDDKEEKEEK